MESKTKIAIIGTAGIPSKYGGFETLTEYLTRYIGEKFQITVFCSSKIYSLKKKQHNNAVLRYINLKANGPQSIFYDIVSLFLAAKKHDRILILGISGCVILPFFRFIYPNKQLIINIDGLEHKREKWKKSIQKFLKYSEKLAVKYCNVIISDNKAIQEYVKKEYNRESTLIAYGGDHSQHLSLNPEIIKKYNLPPQYAFKVCRIEPENNIHLVLEAFEDSSLPLVIIGNWSKSKYGIKLKEKYLNNFSIKLLEPIYNQDILDQIRSNCKIYIHGHSAGGTNPYLVEAMNLSLPIFAFDVSYNRETTFNKAMYFKDSNELRKMINHASNKSLDELGERMGNLAKKNYSWISIILKYEELFRQR